MTGFRKALAAATVAVGSVVILAGPAGAQTTEVVYNPASPQGSVLDILTDNWIPFAGMMIAIAIAAVPLILAAAGVDGVFNTLRGFAKKARKGRGR